MKKFIKISLVILLIFFITILGVLTYLSITASNAKLDSKKLINLNKSITYLDRYNNELTEMIDGNDVAKISDIPTHTINAFVAIEDKRFYTHNGVDVKRLFGSLLKNLTSFSFKEGGSTISQQLIKNTHLTSEKTLTRKAKEIKLALDLEKKYSKNEIMEKYLNTIYFGDNCYGISSAANYYFNKSTRELSINESATLAAIVKAPSLYSPIKNIDNCTKRKNLVLKEMLNQGYINNEIYQENTNKNINLNITQNKGKNYDGLYLVNKELSEIFSSSPYDKKNVVVQTSIDLELQKIIEKNLNDFNIKEDYSAILINSSGEICAYKSTCGDINRQAGSTLKPLAVYAPAIENNLITPYTKINDGKVDYNGYNPSNYNDVYYGDVSVKFALAKSINTCSVKILNSLGVDKSISYLEKMNINLDDRDNSLCIALGNTANGIKFTDLVAAYTTLLNGGEFYEKHTIKSIKTSYATPNKMNRQKIKVFSSDTTFLINDMTRFAVTDGTAKKLSFNNFNLRAKTGTVGTKNGNTDAYVISYNPEYVLGVWIGKSDGTSMSNSISGGTTPSQIANEIWKEIYKNKTPPSDFLVPSTIKEAQIDLISYEDDNILELADDYAPEKYKKSVYLRNNNTIKQKSTRFSSPKIEKPKLTVNLNEIAIELCQTKLYNALIFKEQNGKKILVGDVSIKDRTTFIDEIDSNGEITYSIVPYYKFNDGKNSYGDEIFLEKIKPSVFTDGWWENEFE